MRKLDSAFVGAPLAPTTESPPKATRVTQVTQAGARTEVGVIESAPYRIDVPATWNGGLVLYCHGYGARRRLLSADTAGRGWLHAALIW